MDTHIFIIHIKTKDFYENFINDIEKWIDTSNYNEDDKGQLSIQNSKKKSFLFKDELRGKTIIEFAALRAKHMYT